jgi:hypothetical protein
VTTTTSISQEDAATVGHDLDDTIAAVTEVRRLMRGGAPLGQVVDAIYEAKDALDRAQAYVDSLDKDAS